MTGGLVDALAHLDDARVEHVAALLGRARVAGVAAVLSAGTDPRKPRPSVAAPGIEVWLARGLHPMFIDEKHADTQLDALVRDVEQSGVVALGEIGLDARARTPRAQQRELFERQLDLAHRHQLPVVLHVVRMWPDTLAALDAATSVRGYVHGFAGSPETAAALIARGLSLSFGGQLTDPRVKKARAAASGVPLDRLLVESDTPDHPPRGVHPAPSEPAHIHHVLDALAALRPEDRATLATATARNARACLGRGPGDGA